MIPPVLCRLATPFTAAWALDEAALRANLQRMAEAGLGVCLGHPGAGEGHALTNAELDRVYRVGVEVCKGRVPVLANPPEQPTARDTREQLGIAAAAGVDRVNLYGPQGRHGYKPTDHELMLYYDEVLPAANCAVALAADAACGHLASAELVAGVCDRYSRVEAVNLGDPNEDYLLTFKARLKRPVEIFIPSPAALRMLDLGVSGVLSVEANVLPRTCRAYLDFHQAGKAVEATAVYQQLKRFSQYVGKWGPSHARWLKMCMKVLRLPGGQGGIREPYLMPGEEDLGKFRAGLLALGIPEIDEAAKRA